MPRIAHVLIIFYAGFLAALPALASDRPALCRHAAAIVDVAGFLMEDPRSPPRFWRNPYGDDAAYLAIRYGGMTYRAGSALLERLSQVPRKAPRIEELRLAFADRADRPGLFEALVKASDNAGVLNRIGPSAMRAMLLDGDAARLYAVLDRWRADRPDEVRLSEAMLADALLDLDDGDKSRLAAGAEAAGEWGLAGQILMRRGDLGEWLALRKRAPDAPKTAELAKIEYLSAVRLMGRAAPLDLDKLPAEMAPALDRARFYQAQWDPLVAAARASPRAQILVTLLNQTGEERIAAVAAANFAAAVAGGKLDAADGDAVVIRMAEELAAVLGRGRLQGLLAPLYVPSGWASRINETAQDALDRALARQALAALARGETEARPQRPASLSAGFPWQAWVDAAASRQPIAPDEQGLDFEMATLRGDYAGALATLKPIADARLAHLRADALLRDLDWRCSKLLGPPNPFQLPVYMFERE